LTRIDCLSLDRERPLQHQAGSRPEKLIGSYHCRQGRASIRLCARVVSLRRALRLGSARSVHRHWALCAWLRHACVVGWRESSVHRDM